MTDFREDWRPNTEHRVGYSPAVLLAKDRREAPLGAPSLSQETARISRVLHHTDDGGAVATLMLLHRATVKTLDKEALLKVQAERPLDGISVLGADEIAVGKGQNYWTMISALEGPRGPELLSVVARLRRDGARVAKS